MEAGVRIAERFLLQEPLGAGGMGEVWRTWDGEVGEEVALKLLHETAISDLVQFRSEVRLARRVTHRNVARTHDLGRDAQGRWFITMELVPGRSLREVLREGPLTLVRTVDLLSQVADGLAAAHNAGVVHRDLKPANVMVETSGRAVLTDFGIASTLLAANARDQVAVGTPAYMAPEQLLGEPLDARTDLYALGVMLFELVSGRRPFPKGDEGLSRRIYEPAPDVGAHRAVPEALGRLIARLLEREPSARPDSAAAVAARLRSLVQGEPTQSLSSRVPVVASSNTLRVTPLRWLGAPGDAWLAEAMTEALTDALTRTRGLSVTHTAGARWTIQGSVQRAPDRMRVSARLLDAAGTQVWSDRVEAVPDDVLALQDRLGAKIAEELRLAIHLNPSTPLPWSVVERYLRARLGLRAADNDLYAVATELSAVLADAPGFTAAVALNALCQSRIMRLGRPEDRRAAELAVSTALEVAQDQPETCMAAASMAADDNRFRDAVVHLQRAVELAPGAATAHGYLASLQCEAGPIETGLAGLRHATQLEPTLRWAWMELARQAALNGDLQEAARLLQEAAHPVPDPPVIVLGARISAWYGDLGPLRMALEQLPRDGKGGLVRMVGLWGAALLGDRTPASVAQAAAPRIERAGSRRTALYHQLLVEAFAAVGDTERALTHLRSAAEGALIDLRWMDLCPPLAPLRDLPDFELARQLVRVRAERMWHDR